MSDRGRSRRRLLSSLAVAVGTLAGCTGQDAEPTGETTPTEDTAAEPTATATTTPAATVEIVATFPAADGTEQRRETVLEPGDFASVGQPQAGTDGRPPSVPVTLTEEAASQFASAMQEYGFTSGTGIGACRYRETPDDPGYCLYTVVDGTVRYAAGMSSGLARNIESGEFSTQPAFVLLTSDFEAAQRVATALRNGSTTD